MPHPGDPGRLDVAERFRDRAAFDAHQARTAASAWGAATRHLVRHYRIEEESMTTRCAWAASDPLMQAYHDTEWGVPERDGRALWEKLVLDGFQAGLAWITVLRKRDAFRAAFQGFDPAAVARFGDADVARLLADPGIIRSRAKIDATIAGARLYCAMADRGEDFAAYCWGFTDGQPIRGDGVTLPPRPTSPRPSPRTSSAAASSSSARPSSMPGCRPSASSTTIPPPASAAEPPHDRHHIRHQELHDDGEGPRLARRPRHPLHVPRL